MVNSIYDIIFRLLAATFVGVVIGLERQLKGHPIGMRTNALVCVASAGVMILSQLMVAESYMIFGTAIDPRLAPQVITGIGFLGAGTIMHSDSNVKGLTTAASLWSVRLYRSGVWCWLLRIWRCYNSNGVCCSADYELYF